MADRFPNVSFDWLGQLPALANAAEDRRIRKTTLADLKSGNADDLLSAGAKLLAAGNIEDGTKLINAGNQRKAVDQRGEELRLFLSQPRPDVGGLVQGGQPAEPPGGPASFPGGGAPATVPPAQNLFNGPQGAIPGVTQAPPQPGPQQAMSPSEQILAQAQGGMQAPPPGPQLAGPPPTPNTAPAAAPDWLKGAAAPAVGAGGTQAPQLQLEPPSAQGISSKPDPAIMRNIAKIAQEMAKPSTRYGAGERQALAAMMKQQIDLTHWNEKTKAFMTDQADRRAAGQPVQSRNEWDAENTTRETTYKSAVKKYEGYSEDAQKGQNLNSVLGAMEQIVQHPQFISGKGSPAFAQGVSTAAALLDTAKALGVPKGILDKFSGIGNLTEPAALQEAFTALSNQAIFAKLGSLGNQISEGDRNFIQMANASLSLTKEGNMFLIGILRQAAANAEKSGAVAQQYFEQAGPRANPAIVDRMVREAAKENSLFVKDGKVTDAGEAVRAAVKAAREGSLQAPEQPKPQAAPPAQGRARPLNGPKTPENPSGRYIQLPSGQIVPENQT